MSKKTFISFSDLAPSSKGGPPNDNGSSANPSASLVYSGSDADLAVCSKKLLKKDVVTRIKAINDVLGILQVCVYLNFVHGYTCY